MNKRDKKLIKTNQYNKQHTDAILQKMIQDKNKRLQEFEKEHKQILEVLNQHNKGEI